jgi:hypothetical protein
MPMGIKNQVKGKRKIRRRWQMGRHSEATRKLKHHMNRIGEETFQTILHSLTMTADTDYSSRKQPKTKRHNASDKSEKRTRPGPEVM